MGLEAVVGDLRGRVLILIPIGCGDIGVFAIIGRGDTGTAMLATGAVAVTGVGTKLGNVPATNLKLL